MTITAAQCHAGRILAEVQRDDLANEAGLSTEAVAAFEAGEALLSTGDLERLRQALEAFGVRLICEDADGGIGVRLKFDRAQTNQISAWETERGAASSDEIA